MNFLQHRQKSQGHVLPMPEGLQELMADISREVLRCQPSIDCTYKFIADYLEAMLKTREKSKIAMEIIEDAILKIDEVYEKFAECHIPKEKTHKYLDMMEVTFRRFVEQKRRLKEDPRLITFHADDMLDELMRKCDLTKVEILKSRPAIQWAYKKFVKTYLAAVEGTLDTEGMYVEADKYIASSKELQELNDSAVKIQKVYRGYHTRKCLQESPNLKTESIVTSLELQHEATDDTSIMDDHDELTKAAVKIQATYKGFQVRKKMSSKSPPASCEGSFSKEAIQEPPMAVIDGKELVEEILDANELEDMNKAAITIQASFKGHKVRKEMKEAPPRNP